MLADLDLLLTMVFYVADNLLPAGRPNARRRLSDSDECARSRETVKRAGASRLDDPIANAAGYGYCRSHSRWFFGMRLHTAFGPDGTPRAIRLAGADPRERDVALELLPCTLRGGETVIADKGYAGREYASAVGELGATLVRPAREPTNPNAAPTSRHCANASSRSTGPPRTCSPSNATARAPCATCAPASCNACSHSPPASTSITGSDAPAAHSSTTPPDRPAESII